MFTALTHKQNCQNICQSSFITGVALIRLWRNQSCSWGHVVPESIQKRIRQGVFITIQHYIMRHK